MQKKTEKYYAWEKVLPLPSSLIHMVLINGYWSFVFSAKQSDCEADIEVCMYLVADQASLPWWKQ
jgi:hypothetical protein